MPSALMEKCRGPLPPAGNSWTLVNLPVAWSMENCNARELVIYVLVRSYMNLVSSRDLGQETIRNHVDEKGVSNLEIQIGKYSQL